MTRTTLKENANKERTLYSYFGDATTAFLGADPPGRVNQREWLTGTRSSYGSPMAEKHANQYSSLYVLNQKKKKNLRQNTQRVRKMRFQDQIEDESSLAGKQSRWEKSSTICWRNQKIKTGIASKLYRERIVLISEKTFIAVKNATVMNDLKKHSRRSMILEEASLI